MITVACVLRPGGDFDARWVRALQAGVERHLSLEHRFVCLTDAPIEGVIHQYLLHDWPGWWSKMELFRPGLFRGRVLYLDLDTLIVGALDGVAGYDGSFAMLSDFYKPERPQSGVMAFRPSDVTRGIWETFSADPESAMRDYRGDGEWLAAHTEPDRLQDAFPGQIVSLKVHARDAVPDGARLVCGHGDPRFSDAAAGWAHETWSERAA